MARLRMKVGPRATQNLWPASLPSFNSLHALFFHPPQGLSTFPLLGCSSLTLSLTPRLKHHLFQEGSPRLRQFFCLLLSQNQIPLCDYTPICPMRRVPTPPLSAGWVRAGTLSSGSLWYLRYIIITYSIYAIYLLLFTQLLVIVITYTVSGEYTFPDWRTIAVIIINII